MTGATVEADVLAQAHGVIDVFSGADDDDVADLSDRDLRLLRMAVCYQAAWMVSQIDVLSRMEVKSLGQDGSSVTPARSDSMVLAPLAQRCIRQLSWKGARSLPVRPQRRFGAFGTFEEYSDAWLRDECPGAWRPL